MEQNIKDQEDMKEFMEESPEKEVQPAGEAEEPEQAEEGPFGDSSADDKEASEDDGSSLDAEDAVEEKKGFFGKKKEKKDKKDLQIEELNDRLKRNLAEFENFRKRTEKEKSAMYEIGAKDIIEKILPVLDNFERGLLTRDAEEENPFADGMEMIYKQMMKTLEEAGVSPIEAVGEEFNPDLHNAVMHVEDESVGESVVVEELLKGYTYRGSVIRYSMVKVAN